MEDKNRNVFVELRCIYHMHNEQRKSSMPIPKFCSKLSHTIPNAYTKIKTCLRITYHVFDIWFLIYGGQIVNLDEW